MLRAALAERDVEGKRTKARAVVDALLSEAIDGNAKAIEQVFDRIDGILQPVKTEALDIGALIEAVAKRAELRKRERTAD